MTAEALAKLLECIQERYQTDEVSTYAIATIFLEGTTSLIGEDPDITNVLDKIVEQLKQQVIKIKSRKN